MLDFDVENVKKKCFKTWAKMVMSKVERILTLDQDTLNETLEKTFNHYKVWYRCHQLQPIKFAFKSCTIFKRIKFYFTI